MVIIYNQNLKPEYWDANLDCWLETWQCEGASDCVWFVPGTDVEAHWNWEA